MVFFLLNLAKIFKKYEILLVYYKDIYIDVRCNNPLHPDDIIYIVNSRKGYVNELNEFIIFNNFNEFFEHYFSKNKGIVEKILLYNYKNNNHCILFNYTKQLAIVVIKRWCKFVNKQKVFRKLLKSVAEHLGNPRFINFNV